MLMTLYSAVFPARRRNTPAALLLVALPVLLSLSLVSYLYIYYLPATPTTIARSVSQASVPMEKQVDLTIIGGGLAGLTASIEAATLNPSLRILLVEKEKKLGGNSAKASSGINAALDDADEPVFTQDTLKSGGGFSDEKLVGTFIPKTPNAVEFLEKYEVDLSVLAQLGGHSAKRTHRNKSGPNVGFAIISALQKHVATLDNVEVLVNTTADHFLLDSTTTPATVTGVELHTTDGQVITTQSPRVILTTGGFSASHEMLKRYAPGMEKFPTTNGPWALGEGVKLGEAVGAELVGMDKVQLHPTGFVNPKDREAGHRILCPEAMRGSGALMFNKNGKRFVNELSTRDKVSQAMLEQDGNSCFMLLFEDGAKAMASSLGFYKHVGIVTAVQSVKEAAEFAHFDDAEDVLAQLNAYAKAATGSEQDPYGKVTFPFPIKPIASVDTPVEIQVMEVAPTVHYTMGGLKIDEDTRVLNQAGQPIAGLYAAGEVSGGLHGANRLGGNSLAECVVFGRVAAQTAVKQQSP